MDQIPKPYLEAIRHLNDADLVKLIALISEQSWRQAEETLKLMMSERRPQ